MKKNICTFLLLFSVLTLFGQTGYKQNFGDLVAITFPQKPETIDTLGQRVSQFIDSTAIYSVLSREFNFEEIPHIHSEKLSQFYDGTINGFLKASGGKLIGKHPFEIDGLKGVEIELVSTANPNVPDLRFTRFLLLNNSLITINFWTLSENREATQKNRTEFFNSLVITADKTSLTQGIDHPAAFMLGSLMGKLFAWAIILGLIAGVVLLIRKITSKRKAKADSNIFLKS